MERTPASQLVDMFSFPVDDRSGVSHRLAKSIDLEGALWVPDAFFVSSSGGGSKSVWYAREARTLKLAEVRYERGSGSNLEAHLDRWIGGARPETFDTHWQRITGKDVHPKSQTAISGRLRNIIFGPPPNAGSTTRMAQPTPNYGTPPSERVEFEVPGKFGRIRLHNSHWEGIRKLNQTNGRQVDKTQIETALRDMMKLPYELPWEDNDRDHGGESTYVHELEVGEGEVVLVAMRWTNGRPGKKGAEGEVAYAARLRKPGRRWVWSDLRGVEVIWDWFGWLKHLARHPHSAHVEHLLDTSLAHPRILARHGRPWTKETFGPPNRVNMMLFRMPDAASTCWTCGREVASRGSWLRVIVWYGARRTDVGEVKTLYENNLREAWQEVEHEGAAWILGKS